MYTLVVMGCAVFLRGVVLLFKTDSSAFVDNKTLTEDQHFLRNELRSNYTIYSIFF